LVMNELTLHSSAAPVTALKSVPNSSHRSSSSPKSESTKAAEREAARIRWLLAINPNTPTPVLEHLANDSSPVMLERIAENPRSTSATLTRLAAHGNPQVRAAVAENANLSPKTAWQLAKDASADVRMRLAESYFAPLEVLKVLCGDENPYVQHRAQVTLGRLIGEVNAFRLA
jgi:hypothetical protein